nr:hypothetical protein [Tanacetum cinerariifolium]
MEICEDQSTRFDRKASKHDFWTNQFRNRSYLCSVNNYIGGQPSATARTVPAAQEPQVCQTSTTSTSIAESAPTPTNSSSLATNFPNTSQDVDELNLQQQHAQQQGTQAHLQPETVADNVPSA